MGELWSVDGGRARPGSLQGGPDGRYETLAGFVQTQLGRLPSIGDTIEALGHRFTVVAMDGRRAAHIKITLLVLSLPLRLHRRWVEHDRCDLEIARVAIRSSLHQGRPPLDHSLGTVCPCRTTG